MERRDAPAWPLANEAKRRLMDWAVGQKVGLAYGERGVDRHGDVVAHVYLSDGTWLQSRLADEGLARVQTRADMRACATLLLAAEQAARTAKRGIWNEPFYRVRTADDLDADIGSFQIVEGKVRELRRGSPARLHRDDLTRRRQALGGGGRRPLRMGRKNNSGARLDLAPQRTRDRTHAPGTGRSSGLGLCRDQPSLDGIAHLLEQGAL
jgi:hypothetical protein